MNEKIICKQYEIHFKDWKTLQERVQKNYSKRIIIVDENTERHCLPVFLSHFEETFSIISIPAGETYKNLTTAQFIWEEMMRLGADRHSLCLNLGGGVIGDMGGWTAASYMRGMEFIQIPTTLLSMVDASVGGKLAVDFQGVKNIIGLIKDPEAVFIFPEFLSTLSGREKRSGFAEILKHGLIADQNYWIKAKEINPNEYANWTEIIYESVIIKKSVTEEDPLERGLRKILNFGHTLGHAIESISFQDEDPLLHGEAIAIGMITEGHLSFQLGMLAKTELEQITDSIINLYGHHPKYIPSAVEAMTYMRKDKKNKAGNIRFSLLKAIGKANYDQEASPKQIETALNYYKYL